MNICFAVSSSLKGMTKNLVVKFAMSPSAIEMGSAGRGMFFNSKINKVMANPTNIQMKQMIAVKKSPELNDLPTRML